MAFGAIEITLSRFIYHPQSKGEIMSPFAFGADLRIETFLKTTLSQGGVWRVFPLDFTAVLSVRRGGGAVSQLILVAFL